MPHQSQTPSRPSRGFPLRWLLLSTLFALVPGLGLEAWFRHSPRSLDLARVPSVVRPDSRSAARRSLHLEVDLRRYVQGDRPVPQVLLMGNSLIVENVDVDALQACCAQVDERANYGVTLLEVAMLGEWIVKIKPALLVLALTGLDVYRSPGWDGLRFYDPSVARKLSSAGDLVKYSRAHLRGMVQRHFTLFRHRQALLELGGITWGLPLESMFQVVPKTQVVFKQLEPSPLPTVQTQALDDLAGRLRAADIGLLVFSSPIRAGGKRPDHKIVAHIPQMDAHMDVMARRHGFDYLPAGHLRPIDPGLYKDGVHLLPEGRTLLTEQLVPHIEAALARRRGD